MIWKSLRQVLRQTELENFSARLMNELSGGERQRAVLARALATEAGILLLDEPTANLDLAHQASMLQLVRAHCDERAAAAVIVTHDINLAAEFADHVVLLKDGRLIAAGKPHEVLTEELLKRGFGNQSFGRRAPALGCATHYSGARSATVIGNGQLLLFAPINTSDGLGKAVKIRHCPRNCRRRRRSGKF